MYRELFDRNILEEEDKGEQDETELQQRKPVATGAPNFINGTV